MVKCDYATMREWIASGAGALCDQFYYVSEKDFLEKQISCLLTGGRALAVCARKRARAIIYYKL